MFPVLLRLFVETTVGSRLSLLISPCGVASGMTADTYALPGQPTWVDRRNRQGCCFGLNSPRCVTKPNS